MRTAGLSLGDADFGGAEQTVVEYILGLYHLNHYAARFAGDWLLKGGGGHWDGFRDWICGVADPLRSEFDQFIGRRVVAFQFDVLRACSTRKSDIRAYFTFVWDLITVSHKSGRERDNPVLKFKGGV